MEETKKLAKPEMTFGEELRFTPYAWAKLIWMQNRGKTEVAGYGVTETTDPLLVTDFILIKQECTGGSFDLDSDDSVEYMERMSDKGLMPWMFSNLLIHTHPGNDPSPSGTDEDNFKNAFSHPHWAIMLIVAENGKTYCRLKLNVGPGVVKELEVFIDWDTPFNGTDIESWEKEYKSNVREINLSIVAVGDFKSNHMTEFQEKMIDPLWWDEDKQEFIGLNETKQEFNDDADIRTDITLEELEDLDCCWDADGNVCYWGEGNCYIYDPIRKNWYEDSQDGGDDIEIEKPNRSWADKVVTWANHFANDRVVLMEN